MKINIPDLGFEEITFSDLIGEGAYSKDVTNYIRKVLISKGYYDDDWMTFSKKEGSEIIDCSLKGSWETIHLINAMEICKNDPFIMIVKDAWYGYNSDGDDVGYISFEVIPDEQEPPPTLKGGHYEKKSFMNDQEFNEFIELRDKMKIEEYVKYQDFYFERSNKYNAKEWINNWLKKDYEHNDSL